MVVNGANKFIDLEHMKKVKEEFFSTGDVRIEYLDTRQLLAVQGILFDEYNILIVINIFFCC